MRRGSPLCAGTAHSSCTFSKPEGVPPIDAEGCTAVIADPQPLFLEAVRSVLSQLGIAISGMTTSYSSAVDLIAERKPELVVLGMSNWAGEANGVDWLRRARGRHQDFKAILISDDDTSSSIAAAFAAGAAAYLTRTATADDLAVAVRQTFDRSTIYLPTQAVQGVGREGGPRLEGLLTRREYEILKLVSSGRSNSAVAKLLWVTEQTVKFHLSNIYRKLGVTNRTEAASKAAQLRRSTLGEEPVDATPPPVTASSGGREGDAPWRIDT